MATDTSADAEDLAWDHTADTLEISPLLDGYSTGQSTFFRTPVFNPRNLPLTIVQTEDLLSNLESTSAVLRAYLSNAKESQVQRQRSRQKFCCPFGFRQCLHKNISFLTAVIQALNLLILTLIDVWPNKDDNTVLIVSALTMSLTQLVNLVFIIMTSAKLVKEVLVWNAARFSLVSNYIATLLLFSGLYTLTYRVQPSGWKFFQEDTHDSTLAVIIFLKFLFFSVSKATLCGTDSVLPNDWYNYILVALQMLISFAYLIAILRSALSTRKAYQPIKTQLRYRRETSEPEVIDNSVNHRSYHDYGSIESR